jgi:hypothetical protein
LIICCVLLLAPATAGASVVYGDNQNVTFQAAPGESNRVTVTGAGVLVVTDAGAPLAAGSGCTPVDVHTAECTVPLQCTGFFVWSNEVPCGFIADFGDRDDALDAQTEVPVTARGEDGDDRLQGGQARDRLSGGTGADFIQGRGSDDLVTYEESGRSGGVVVRLDDAAGDGAAGEDDDVRTESIWGTPKADVLVGNFADNFINGGGGADRVRCRGGFDWVITQQIDAAAATCEVVLADYYASTLRPEPDGALRVHNGAVAVRMTPWTADGVPAIVGKVTLTRPGGRVLGSIDVTMSQQAVVQIPVSRAVRRTLKRRPEWIVRVTGTNPGRSVVRALARLRT